MQKKTRKIFSELSISRSSALNCRSKASEFLSTIMHFHSTLTEFHSTGANFRSTASDFHSKVAERFTMLKFSRSKPTNLTIQGFKTTVNSKKQQKYVVNVKKQFYGMLFEIDLVVTIKNKGYEKKYTK